MQCVCTALEVENFDFTRKTVFEFHAKFHHLDQRVVPETSKSHFSKSCRVEIGRRVEGGIRQSSPSCLLIYGVCCSLFYSTLDLVYVLWRKGQKTTYCIILGFLQFAPRSRPKSKLPDLQEYRRLMSDNIGTWSLFKPGSKSWPSNRDYFSQTGIEKTQENLRKSGKIFPLIQVQQFQAPS